MAALIVNTTHTNERQSTHRELCGFRAKVRAFFRDSAQHAVAEGSRVKMFGLPQTNCTAAPNPTKSESPGAGLEPLVESSPRTATGFGRRIARGIMSASLVLAALAGAVAIQASIHAYVWRLAG